MIKRFALAVIAVFVAWSVLDFIIHGFILQSTYMATAELWRPMEEMKMVLMYLVSLIATCCFVGVYTLYVQPKSIGTGLSYGLIFGIGGGISMGIGTYCVMPVPLSLGLIWFAGFVVETVIGGLLLGLIVKEQQPETEES